MWIEFAILTGTFWLCLYLYVTRHFHHWKNKKVPFLKPLPFFGNSIKGLLMQQSMGEIFNELYYSTTAPFLGFFLIDSPCVLVRDPELIKNILVNDFQHFYDRVSIDNKRDDPIGSYVLFVLKNPDWKQIRTKITPVFTSSKMKNMFQLIQKSCNDLTTFLHESTPEDCLVDIREVCAKFTVDVISSCSFGIEAHCFEEKESQFRRVARRLFDWTDLWQSLRMRCYFIAPTLVKIFRMKFLNFECTTFLKDVFWDIMDKRSASGATRNDLIDILIQMKSLDKDFALEGDKLVAQAVQFFVAGFETSSSTMMFTLFELAKHQDFQDKLREEINETWKKANKTDTLNVDKEELLKTDAKSDRIDYDYIKDMAYLDMCVKEVLRLYPVLPFLDRKCNSDYQIPGTDVVIDKGTPLFISTYALHRDPQYFRNPEVFDPERFSPSNWEGKKFYYLPFGEGPRNCIGERFGVLTTKLGLLHILRNYKVDVCAGTNPKLKFDPRGVLLAPVEPIMLKFTRVI